MTTATELVTAAFGKILVRSADVPLEADELQDGISQLNRMMDAWNYSTLGYTTVTSGSDTLTVPGYAEDGMIFGLAERLAPDYGAALTPEFNNAKKQAMKDLKKRVITIGRAPYPSTLPRGSGNNRLYVDRDFYDPSTAEQTP